jgi:hypothetical protein
MKIIDDSDMTSFWMLVIILIVSFIWVTVGLFEHAEYIEGLKKDNKKIIENEINHIQ